MYLPVLVKRQIIWLVGNIFKYFRIAHVRFVVVVAESHHERDVALLEQLADLIPTWLGVASDYHVASNDGQVRFIGIKNVSHQVQRAVILRFERRIFHPV